MTVHKGFVPFEHVATEIVSRLAGLLEARVWAVNSAGNLVASSAPGTLPGNRRLLPAPDGKSERAAASERDFMRVPFSFGGQSGMLIIDEPVGSQVTSARATQMLIDLVLKQRLTAAQSRDRQEQTADFMRGLLRGETLDEALVHRQARQLQFDLAIPRVVLLVDASDYIVASPALGQKPTDVQVRRRADVVTERVVAFLQRHGLLDSSLASYLGRGEVTVLLSCDAHVLRTYNVSSNGGRTRALESTVDARTLDSLGTLLLDDLNRGLQASMQVVYGRYHAGIEGLVRSYEDARMATQVARSLSTDQRVCSLESLCLPAFVGHLDMRAKTDLARQLLTPLEHDPQLLDTLRIFFEEDYSFSISATRLSIHRNTLTYRLDKITQLTSLDPRKHRHALELGIALHLLDSATL